MSITFETENESKNERKGDSLDLASCAGAGSCVLHAFSTPYSSSQYAVRNSDAIGAK